MESAELAQLLQACIVLARQAGEAILPYWKNWHSLSVQLKADKTPVTAADLAAHHILAAGLQALAPWPILSEEGEIPSYYQRQQWDHYWLVDPLDGTRGFVRGSNEFSVNIALIVNHQPILGVIYAPVQQLCYYASYQSGAFKQESNQTAQALLQEHVFQPPWRIAVGQYHRLQKLKHRLPADWTYSWLRLNSSLKFCALADNSADVYVRFGPTCEWDTAAGHCILHEVGGVIVDLNGQSLQYNRKVSLLNPNFFALANASFLQQWLTILTKENKK